MEIYDIVSADAIEENDCIMVDFDPVEVKTVTIEDDAVYVHGYSHMSGDMVDYFLPYDKEVGLWGA